MKILRDICVTLSLLFAAILGFVSPAQAYTPCNGYACTEISHHYDLGYDEPFLVKCSTGENWRIPEGHSSAEVCGDVWYFWVHANERIRCTMWGGGWYTWLSGAPGWRQVNNVDRNCVAQLDSVPV